MSSSRHLGRFAGIAAAVLATVLISACGGSSSSSSSGSSSNGQTTLSVNLIPIADLAAVYVGQKQGFFAQHGLKLKITTSPSGGPAIIPSLISGQDQIGIPAYSDLILAVAKRFPIVSIGSADSAGPTNDTDYQYLVALKGSGISSVKQLVGKTVAINSLNGLGQVQVDAALEHAGVDYHTVHFVAINFPQMAAALTAHRVDAAQLVEPFFTQLKSQTPTNVLAGLDYAVAPNLPVTAILTTKSYYSQHRDVVSRFQAAMRQSLQYTSSHPALARSVVPGYTGIPAALASKILMPYFPTTQSISGIRQMESDMRKFGIISSSPPLSSFVEPVPGS